MPPFNLFQSTPPRRRRHKKIHRVINGNQFQSTPPRRRRLDILHFGTAELISIHASAKEATDSDEENLEVIKFQSTPPRRRRPSTPIIIPVSCDFNPRLREGGDHCSFSLSLVFCMISIHASAKEATLYDVKEFYHNIFQSTPPRRRRHKKVISFRCAILFQSTPPRRRRPSSGDTQTKFAEFQSTPPRRRRRSVLPVPCLRCHFNPRLREGGDGVIVETPLA